MAIPNVLVLRSPGSNCDGELKFAFDLAGARADLVHINRLRESPRLLENYQVLAVPGGFSYGDDVAAGKILATQLGQFLGEAIRQFRDAEKLILGVCNGFQALLKAGVLIPPDLDDGPRATLARNEPPGFQDRWVRLKATPGKCPFLKDIDQMLVPIAHGEGRFICRPTWVVSGLEEAGQVVLKYCGLRTADCGLADGSAIPNPKSEIDNPNGSQNAVAGVCDPTGRVLGLMPHPERHVLPTQHPQWTRLGLQEEGEGLKLFRNAVAYFA